MSYRVKRDGGRQDSAGVFGTLWFAGVAMTPLLAAGLQIPYRWALGCRSRCKRPRREE